MQNSSSLIATTLSEAQTIVANASKENWRTPSKTLMVSPEYFRIDYAINPFMKNELGELKTVDVDLASQQWTNLKNKFISLGSKVFTLPGKENLPDMVFAANQSLVFWHDGRPHALMSKMAAPERRPEVSFFEEWYRSQNYVINRFETKDVLCEGNGDVLLDPEFRMLWGGVGSRTNLNAYREISARFNIPVVTLPLRSPDFYHLDTCFAILNAKTVALQTRAFDDETLSMVRARFERVIEIDFSENISCFAGNCHSPNGIDVVLQKGAAKFSKDLAAVGMRVHEVETGEFMKSGGSVFCMKMMVF